MVLLFYLIVELSTKPVGILKAVPVTAIEHSDIQIGTF